MSFDDGLVHAQCTICSNCIEVDTECFLVHCREFGLTEYDPDKMFC